MHTLFFCTAHKLLEILIRVFEPDLHADWEKLEYLVDIIADDAIF